MNDRLVFCEGKADVRALRGLIRVLHKLQPAPSSPRFPSKPPDGIASFSLGDMSRLDIVEAGNKDKATVFAVQEFRLEASPNRIDFVGLSFDPDHEQPADWVKRVAGLLPAGVSQISDYEWQSVTKARLLLLPWTVSAPVFDGLSDEHNLERVAVLAASQAEAATAPLIEEWLASLARMKGAEARQWKAATLLWHAATWPKVPEASFFDKVFEQDREMAAAAANTFNSQPAGQMLQRLVTP